jgi:hypothetical protein
MLRRLRTTLFLSLVTTVTYEQNEWVWLRSQSDQSHKRSFRVLTADSQETGPNPVTPCGEPLASACGRHCQGVPDDRNSLSLIAASGSLTRVGESLVVAAGS